MAVQIRLRGRESELRALDGVLDAVRCGASRALVLRGDAGIGKSALLEWLGERASGCRVVRSAGVQAEMELPFAGLQLLCAPMLDHLDRLPAPQREALATAFGLWAGPAPDGLLVGLAALSLLSDAAQERPLVCLIDDAQWLDRASAQTLALVARRLHSESVALVFATRDQQEPAGLPELVVEGLRDRDARALLRSALGVPLDEQVLDRIVAETRGNALALLELPRGLSPAELAGGFGPPGAPALSQRIEESFLRRFAPLLADSRRLLLIAAAEPVGDPVLLWRAAERLRIAPDAAAEPEAAGLCEFRAPVRFRHPLVRSAIYQAASPDERRDVHRALAEVTDPDVDPDRRAWHRAHAAGRPDEEVAEELERSAGRAESRGGMAAAAAFLERAAALTPTRAGRAARALAAAHAKYQAGAFEEARALLASAQAGSLDELQRARVDQLRAQIAFAVNRGRDAPPLLLNAARRLEPLDVRLARETYLDALSAAIFVGRLGVGVGLREVAERARAAPDAPDPPRATDLILDGLALVVTEGYPAGTPILKRALQAFRSESVSCEEEIRWGWLACHTATELWDDETLYILTTRHVQLARDAGALTVLQIALVWLVGVHLNSGDFSAAAALVDEMKAVAGATGSHGAPYIALALAVFQGREAAASELIELTVREVVPRGEGVGLTHTEWARAFLYNGLGRYDEALAAAQQARKHPEELGPSTWALAELIEAATRSGKRELAGGALEELSAMTRASGTDWALAVEARARALLSDDKSAEPLYQEAIERLGRTRIRGELARTHLLYGEWLRRRHRRLEAREQLRTAHEMLDRMGLEAFAERATRELLATGATARKRSVETSDRLTAQEAQIARLAAEGLSNPEIGARLFISPRTVQYHLRKVFMKLDVSSRNQLDRVLPGDPVAR
jgi:DNA-binding CsgD family transcriptional regulator